MELFVLGFGGGTGQAGRNSPQAFSLPPGRRQRLWPWPRGGTNATPGRNCQKRAKTAVSRAGFCRLSEGGKQCRFDRPCSRLRIGDCSIKCPPSGEQRMVARNGLWHRTLQNGVSGFGARLCTNDGRPAKRRGGGQMSAGGLAALRIIFWLICGEKLYRGRDWRTALARGGCHKATENNPRREFDGLTTPGVAVTG